MKKFLWLIAGIVFLLILIVLSGWLHGSRLTPDLKSAKLSSVPDREVPVGGTIRLTMNLRLPLNAPAPVPEITPPRDTVLCGPVKVSRGHYRWNRFDWQIGAVLRTIRPGAASGGKIQLRIEGARPLSETFAIPDMVITPVRTAGEKLALAGELTPVRHPGRWPWITVAGLVLILAWIAFRFLRKKREAIPPPLPPWTRAEQALDELTFEVKNRRLPLGQAFVRLTDLVRRYVEERYALPVTVQTTGEFMEDLRESSPLPREDQPFMKEFLTSADLVKFARMPPSESMLMEAVDGARALVRHTRPLVREGEKDV